MKNRFLVVIATLLSITSYSQFTYQPSSIYPFGQPNPEAANEIKDFSPLIGVCDCESQSRNSDNRWAEPIEMTWTFKYIMNGTAIQDEVLSMDGKHGGSIRQFNEEKEMWYVHYYSTQSKSKNLLTWEGKKRDDGSIVLYNEQKAPNGMDGYFRITFSEITTNGFNWIGEWVDLSEQIVFPVWKIDCTKRQLVDTERPSETLKENNGNTKILGNSTPSLSPFRIGYRIIETTRRIDNRRPNDLQTGLKTIPISIWYPTIDTIKPSYITYGDYVNNISASNDSIANNNLFKKLIRSFENTDTLSNPEQLAHYLSRKKSVLNSPAHTQHKYPLVIINGAHPIYHTYLAERIASKGFVVASIPRQGKNKGERLSFDKEGSKEFKADLNCVISELSKTPFVDSAQLSFISWSFEGVPTFEIAKQNKNTVLFISLDSSIGYDYGETMVEDSVAFFQDTPFQFYHFTGSEIIHGKNFNLLDKLNRDSYEPINQWFNLEHADFTSLSSITKNELRNQETSPTYETFIEVVQHLILTHNL
jgi:hypothetical protein